MADFRTGPRKGSFSRAVTIATPKRPDGGIGLCCRRIGLMNNYEFCASFAAKTAKHHLPGFKVLDYGCGAGEIIKLMCDDGLDACGCETFYEGCDLSSKGPAELKDRIFAMQGDRIPFPD